MTDGDGHLPLWFSRFKTRYRFSQLTVCCKIVRHTAPCSFEQGLCQASSSFAS
ncbi:hypothetical protein [Citrobacter freundii]|uniref:Uncharacterized protein n=1 Tax=Citrobacter freundii TaxID=546 RepID=A0A7G2ITC6_CITFR|nr:hypothetical protein [Citrobacter freundii]